MPEYIAYNQGLYNKGNYNQRLATVLAGVFQPAGTASTVFTRVRSAAGVVDASATTVADLGRLLGFDCTAQAAASSTVADFALFLTMASDVVAGSTISISPKRLRGTAGQVSGASGSQVSASRFRMTGGTVPAVVTVVPIINVTFAFSSNASASAEMSASPVLFWEPGDGTAVAFVDGSAGAGVWSDVTASDVTFAPQNQASSTWTDQSATEVNYV